MSKLMINDNFIMNITSFSETVDSSGLLRFVINEPLDKTADLAKFEMLLVNLKTYCDDESIDSVVIIDDETEEEILKTYIFSKITNASLSYDDKAHMTMTIDIVLV